MKRILLGIVVVFVLVIVLAVLLPFVIDLNNYQDRYRPLIEDALNRKVTLGDLRLTILPRLGVRIAGFTVMDDPAFSAGAFASLTSLDVGVKLLPLLTGHVEVEEITLREPVITVIKNRQGVLNISTLGAKEGARPPVPEQPPPAPSVGEGPLRALALLAVEEVSLIGGRLAYEDHFSKKPTEYRIHDLTVTLRSLRLGDTAGLHLAAIVLPYNLPVKIDGELGPLTETLDFKMIDVMTTLGKTIVTVKGSATGDRFNLILTSPVIQSGDLPVSLPLTKPVQIKDLRIATEGRYPLKEGMPIQDAVEVKALNLAVLLGESVINVEGNAIGGNLNVKVASPSIDSRDIPVTLPLTKPILVKDLHLKAKAAYPLNEGAPPQEWVDAADLECLIALDTSLIRVKGSAIGGEIKLTATAPSVKSDDLPIALPLRKPIEATDIRLIADMNGSEAHLQNLAMTVFDGRLFAEGGLTLGSASPPFDGQIVLEKMQLGPILNAFADQVSAGGTAGMQLVVRGRGLTMPDLTKTLIGTGRFTVKDGKIEGVNLLEPVFDVLKAAGIKQDQIKATVFSTMQGDLTIKDGLVNVERFLVDSHDFQATARGTIGFDQALNLRANVNVSEALSKQIAGAAPVAKLALSKGRMSVPLIIAGTAQSPSYTLDGKAMGAKASARVKETLSEVLKGKDGEGLDLEKGAERLKKLFGR
ncbi:MAG: AsmA family protein [Nitrospiraceae bacterium]